MASDIEEQYIAAVDIGTTSLRCYIFNSKAIIVGKAATHVGNSTRFSMTFVCIFCNF